MIADCRQRKQKEQETGKSLHSTEILKEDGQSFDEFLESLNITYEPPVHITARLKVGGKLAKTLLDTGTVGTNLMSLNWAQSTESRQPKWTILSRSEWQQRILGQRGIIQPRKM